MFFILLTALALVLSFYFFTRERQPVTHVLPRIGKPGPVGYFLCAIWFTFCGEECVAHGREQFYGRPFIIPTLGQPLVVIGPEDSEILRTGNDAIVS